VSAAVCVIQALAVLAAFPVVLYFLSGGQGRGEASMIVSLLFLVPLGIVAAAGAAARCCVSPAGRRKALPARRLISPT
jgi:hypothetical protein